MSLRRFHYGLLILGVYWAALFVATHIPLPRLASQEVPDKTIHFCAYGGLALLLASVWGLKSPPTRYSNLAIFGLIASYGIADEALQTFVPTRGVDPLDWLADILGAGLGLTAYAFARWLFGRLTVRRTAPQGLSSNSEPVSDEASKQGSNDVASEVAERCQGSL